MFVLEYKVKPKPNQIEAINEAIRTTQFVRNKVLRYWMDNPGVGKIELFRYNTALRKEFKFVDDLNSHACQTAVERTLRAITRFYDNCQNKVGSSLLFMLNQHTRCQDNILLTQKFRKFLKP
jgi:putative transposase